MLCVQLKNYTRACGGVTGGISDILVFDPNDFNFTQGADVAGAKAPYSAMALRTGSGAVATATVASGAVTAINVGTGGTGYVTPPTVVITGAGTGAAATATIVGGVITGITVTTPGTGYTTAPTISFTGGGAVAADGAKLFLVAFQQDEAEWTWKQTVTGCAVKYEHEWIFQLPENGQNLTTFLQALDAAGCCCGLGMVFRLNSGKILVAGEKYVGNQAIPRFTIKNDGSDGTSGKLYDNFNGGNIHLKGSYSRNLYEFSGNWSAIEALM